MQQVREAALACYNGFTDEQKDKAFAIFETMDSDGSGAVSLEEYEEFFGNSNRTDFQELDTEGTGQLGFEEFKTLFYILITSRADRTIPVPEITAEDEDQLEPSESNQVSIPVRRRVKYTRAVIKAITDYNNLRTVGTVVGVVATAATFCTIM